jgi:lipoate-protein ligase A
VNGLLLESEPLDVFGQMALDEALAKSKPAGFRLRFYRWAGAGATFGYAQRVREVEAVLPGGLGGNYTRRPTGGGVVPHLEDLTFACVFPAAGELRPGQIYRRLHTAILEGLRGLGLAARLCTTHSPPAPGGPRGGQCFVEPVEQDILTEAGKVLGGAIRRYGETVLYQGSLQLAAARARAEEFEEALAGALGGEWGVAWARGGVPAAVRAAAAGLEGKYRSAEWVRRR